MIFSEPLLAKALDGSKTVTRRPVKWEVWDTGVQGTALPCRYEADRDYAIQPGRGRKAVGRLRIVDVRRGPLGHYMLTPEASREGFPSFTAFEAYWTKLYGSYDPTQLVDRIEFQLLHPAAVQENFGSKGERSA